MSGPLVLAFETSCDETAVAVTEGTRVLSNVLSSQVEMHARFGGVVPEVAARAHVEAIRSLTHRALREAGVHPDSLDGIAATRGPGLVGSLLVGFSFAKAMAWSRGLPFLGVDHMEGHLFAPRLDFDDFRPPGVVLLASGGHSQVVLINGWGDYRVLGQTIDDAAGEAFDKLARFMGLGFPGGPAIDALSENGRPRPDQVPQGAGRPAVRLLLLRSQDVGGDHPGEGEGIRDAALPGGRRRVDPGGDRRRAGTEDDERGRGPRGRGRRWREAAWWPTVVSGPDSGRRPTAAASGCSCPDRSCAPTTAP